MIMKTATNKKDTSHKKRYGQFFSGHKIAELLSLSLPDGNEYESIVDPMAGEGDLLNAVIPKAISGAHVLGVEIDTPVASICRRRLPNVEVENADAFQSEQLIAHKGWDLVITNPPYVRYQLQRSADEVMPSADAVRINLISQLERLPYLSNQEKEFFLQIARTYSGLSDMAVPSWILCAALVKLDGYLAMVVPETWLNRDYAAPIQYLLMKAFDVLTIVRDVNAQWFSNASVRTCLVVAKRKKIVPLCTKFNAKTLIVDLKADVIGENSLIDRLTWNGLTGGKAFTTLLSKKDSVIGDGFAVQERGTISLFPNFASTGKKTPWIQNEDMKFSQSRSKLPAELQNIMDSYSTEKFISLNDLGISCGQGLRTGANDFFYFRILDETNGEYKLQAAKWFQSDEIITLPKRFIVKCVQKRAQIHGVVADVNSLDTGLLYLQDSVRSCDMNLCSPDAAKRYKIMPNILSQYIAAAEEHVNTRGLTFSEYSAVKTNASHGVHGYERFWYMLPVLASRHIPDLCISRVSPNAANCVYIPQSSTRSIVADANFVTLWCQSERMTKVGLALLNSNWAKCYMELVCTVMGGGALKIEASHVNKLLFPPLSNTQLQELSELGSRIIAGNKVTPKLRDSIDSAILRCNDTESRLKRIKELLRQKLEERGAGYEF